MKLTEQDISILRLIQNDASLSRSEIAERVNMSATTLWRRLKDFEAFGIIDRTLTLLDPEKAGLPVCFIVNINLVNHEAGTLDQFEDFVMDNPEIMECYSMTGAFDFMVIVRVQSVAKFQEFLMGKVLTHRSVENASSSVTLERLKYTTELPL